MNLSNKLTCVRIALAPTFGILVSYQLWLLAGITFIIAIMTDVLDGHIARKRKEVTNAGVILDAVADKIFVAFAIFAVYLAFSLPWYVFFVLTRDVLVSFGGLALLGVSSPGKRIDLRADWSGKTVTVLQVATISLIFTSGVIAPINESLIHILVFLTAAFGLLCSIHYLLRAKHRGYI